MQILRYTVQCLIDSFKFYPHFCFPRLIVPTKMKGSFPTFNKKIFFNKSGKKISSHQLLEKDRENEVCLLGFL